MFIFALSPPAIGNSNYSIMKKILLVDDDPICNLLAQKFLEKIDTPKLVQVAINGLEAVGILREFRPDVILLDLNMPIMNGFQFITAFKKLELKEKENVKIVIVSSSRDSADIERAKDLGINEFMSKPVTIEKLQAII